MKKFLAMLLALVMALGVTTAAWAAQSTPPPVAEKDGTPYTDLHQALEAAKDGGTVKLLGDVELTDTWAPVGTSSEPFKGTFDGGGHKITGLSITSGDYIGLFGYVGDGAVIKNVDMVKASVVGGKRVGALIGQIKGNATVSNCTVDSTSRVTGSDSNTGGLIGEAAGTITVTLENLTNNAFVTNTENGTNRAAGIIAQVTTGANVTITNCVNNGTVRTNSGYAGGIVAALQGTSKITYNNCANTGALHGQYTGNLLGWIHDSARVFMTNSGDAGAAIGAIVRKADAKYCITIDGEEYYVSITKAEPAAGEAYSNKAFSELWAARKTIDRAYMDRIIAFFKYAKQGRPNFANYPESYNALFDCTTYENGTTFFDNNTANGWPNILNEYNSAMQDDMTPDDFKKTWTADVLYSAPAPAPTPDPTPETPPRYYYNSTTTTDTKKDDSKSSPKTFDAGVGIYALTAVLSVTGMAYVGKKKF